MSRILIAYASKHGQTAKVAERLVQILRSEHDVHLFDVGEFPTAVTVAEFDAVIVGAPVYLGRHPAEAVKFVKDRIALLRDMPTAFFSLSLSAAGTDQQKTDAEGCVNPFLQRTDWQPSMTKIFAGSVQYLEYGFFKRLLMKWQMKRAAGDTDTSRNFEYTDWDDVEKFARGFSATLSAIPNSATV
ncbi:MAG: flavodoxin domain-containing protein [Planctomycetaceae bacterium]